MAIRSGFFNSVNGDRKYDASRFAEYFATFISNGVFPNPSTNLQVMANNDMTVTVKVGKAWINGYILINDDDYILEIEPADGVLNRIDRIVARYDVVDREIRLEVKQGDYATNAAPKELQRDADAYELGLADIQVNAGVISISQSAITDLRLNSELCSIVHGTVEQVDTTTLFNQYQTWLSEKKTQYDEDIAQWTQQKQTEYQNWYDTTTATEQAEIDAMQTQFQQDWNTWFAGIQAALDGDTAGNLLDMIDDLAGDGRTTETVKQNADNIQTLQTELASHKNENVTDQYKKSVITADENNNPTEVEYRRKSDNTLAIKRYASNPDTNGYYQTVVEEFYNSDGATKYKTVTYTFTYLDNGLIATSDGGVVS